MAANGLHGLTAEVVFVGGAVLELLVTDRAAAPIRPTVDVDVIAEIVTYADYVAFSERLRALDFSEDSRPNAPLCRWIQGDLTLDVMPVSAAALGFGNRWYRGAMESAQSITLTSGASIRVIAAPFFLGTKMEAFRSRGARDYLMSHDLEDFVSVIEGRETLLDEMQEAPADLKEYLAEAAGELLAEPRFLDALPAYLPGDAISQRRVSVILERLRFMSQTIRRAN